MRASVAAWALELARSACESVGIHSSQLVISALRAHQATLQAGLSGARPDAKAAAGEVRLSSSRLGMAPLRQHPSPAPEPLLPAPP